MQLRDYQTKAIDSLRYSFNTKKKKAPLLVMPTGAGKTVVFASISKALATQDKNVLILVHRKELIDQASNKLKNIEVDHGIIAANYKPKENNIQIASVQTLVRRLQAVSFTPNFIIIDEAHHAAAGSWDKILKHFANAFKIGCTATPIRLDGRGLGDYFDDLIKSDSIEKLIKNEYLAPYRVFAPPLKLNLDKVKVLGGDFQKKDLEDKIEKSDIIGDAVTQYKKHADGLPAIAFCISIKHATSVCEQFKNAGYKSAVVHGEMKLKEREKVIKGLADGSVQVLTSVDVISEGTDCPDASCAILLRPTKSEGLYLQQVGRILRPQKGKTAIILDHVNATRTHGFVDDKRDWNLHSEKKKKKKGEQVPHVETCKKCFATYKPQPTCPVCGYQAQNRERFIKQEEGELEEIRRKEQQETEKKQQRLLIAAAKTREELEMVGKILGYKKGWAYRVYESRKDKTVPRYKASKFNKGKKTASDLPMYQKENIAKIFALKENYPLLRIIEQYNNGTLDYEKIPHLSKYVEVQNALFAEYDAKLSENQIRAKIASFIFKNVGQINQANKYKNKNTLKNRFLQMFVYEWDRAFIINYASAVKQRNILIDPSSISLE